MTEKNSPEAARKNSISQQTGKKPYLKPDFRFEKAFETLALSCGKMPSTTFQCRTSSKNS